MDVYTNLLIQKRRSCNKVDAYDYNKNLELYSIRLGQTVELYQSFQEANTYVITIPEAHSFPFPFPIL